MDDDGVYEYKGGMHQRHRHIWYRIVNGKIVDSDQYRHDLEERALPPEPRTCETCGGNGYTAEHSQALQDHDGEGNCLGACPVQVQCEHCNGTGVEPSPPQSADVEMVRSKIELAIKFGLPIDARMALRDALAALGRIAGKEE